MENLKFQNINPGNLDYCQISGKKDIPGRPLLYRTTKKFLLDFNLADINELPNLSELKQEGLLASYQE